MKTLTLEQVENVAGSSAATDVCQGVSMVAGGTMGFILSLGDPAGAVVGAAAGHWFADSINCN